MGVGANSDVGETLHSVRFLLPLLSSLPAISLSVFVAPSPLLRCHCCRCRRSPSPPGGALSLAFVRHCCRGRRSSSPSEWRHLQILPSCRFLQTHSSPCTTRDPQYHKHDRNLTSFLKIGTMKDLGHHFSVSSNQLVKFLAWFFEDRPSPMLRLSFSILTAI
uniref:Uncharacterized protein LOC105044674 n=1 Tax=Elaeis guineensis var. tenera TaxID=51953 RepID=A0A6I9R5T8_ELAGV|nr:uncharacterized protein LOC105044674 [Elaeis guineensis]